MPKVLIHKIKTSEQTTTGGQNHNEKYESG